MTASRSSADLPGVEIIAAGTPLYRLHRTTNNPAFFDIGVHGRFNPPEAVTRVFGTLYLAREPAAAFIETLGRIRYVRPDDIAQRCLTTVTLARALTGFAIDSPSNRFHRDFDLGAEAVASCDVYTRPQQPASVLHYEDFDAIMYPARHDNSGTLRSFAVPAHPATTPPTTCSPSGPASQWHNRSSRTWPPGTASNSSTTHPCRRRALRPYRRGRTDMAGYGELLRDMAGYQRTPYASWRIVRYVVILCDIPPYGGGSTNAPCSLRIVGDDGIARHIAQYCHGSRTGVAMYVIALANAKGGTAKTTTAVALAAEAAHRGRRTLLVDLDVQANASQHLLGESGGDDGKAVHRAFLDGDELMVVETGAPALSVAPAGRRTQDLADALSRLESSSKGCAVRASAM